MSKFMRGLLINWKCMPRWYEYFPRVTYICLLLPSKLNEILGEVKKALQTTNRDYDLVLKHIYLYYDMKLVTFGIDEDRNLIVQFPVFVQPYTWQQLILYQIETVPVPKVDQNKQAQSYTQLKIEKPYIALNSETFCWDHRNCQHVRK